MNYCHKLEKPPSHTIRHFFRKQFSINSHRAFWIWRYFGKQKIVDDPKVKMTQWQISKVDLLMTITAWVAIFALKFISI